MTSKLYRFREGAIDAIARSRRIFNEDQLAAFLGIRREDLQAARSGAPVNAQAAAYIARMQGDPYYLGAWFDEITPQVKAA